MPCTLRPAAQPCFCGRVSVGRAQPPSLTPGFGTWVHESLRGGLSFLSALRSCVFLALVSGPGASLHFVALVLLHSGAPGSSPGSGEREKGHRSWLAAKGLLQCGYPPTRWQALAAPRVRDCTESQLPSLTQDLGCGFPGLPAGPKIELSACGAAPCLTQNQVGIYLESGVRTPSRPQQVREDSQVEVLSPGRSLWPYLWPSMMPLQCRWDHEAPVCLGDPRSCQRQEVEEGRTRLGHKEAAFFPLRVFTEGTGGAASGPQGRPGNSGLPGSLLGPFAVPSLPCPALEARQCVHLSQARQGHRKCGFPGGAGGRYM